MTMNRHGARAAVCFAMAVAAHVAVAGSARADEGVRVTTNVDGAACEIIQGTGTIYVPRTPALVQIDRNTGGLEIVCGAPGYLEGRFRIGDPFAASHHQAFELRGGYGNARGRQIRRRLRALRSLRVDLEPAS